MIISEMTSGCGWTISQNFDCPIDKTGKTVREYFKERNIHWKYDVSNADFFIYKHLSNVPEIPWNKYVHIIGEPIHIKPWSYAVADTRNTLAVAPGNKFKRFFFGSTWEDPELDSWNDRLDKIIWVGAVSQERLDFAKKLLNAGIDFDIYGRSPWPLPNYKGYLEDFRKIPKKYKYRIVFETSLDQGFHSEKFFDSIRSGCVTFYMCDKNLNIPEIENIYIPLTIDNLKNKENFIDLYLENMKSFMYNDEWEIYSLKSYYNRIISLALSSINK